jgi:hypothetical protein
MASHTNRIDIHAPPHRVFAYVNEPRTLPDWMIGMKEIRNVRGSGEGMQYDWTFKMAGIALRGQNVVVEWEDDRRAAHQGIGMIDSVWVASVEPLDKGTRLQIDVEYTIPIFVLGKLAESATVGRNDRDLKKSLARVQAILESG